LNANAESRLVSVRRCLKDGSKGVGRCFPGWLHRTDPGRLVIEALFIVAAYALYLLVRGSVAGRQSEAFDNAGRVINAEQKLRLFWEADLQAAVLHRGAAEWLVNTTYVWGHLPVIITVAVWLYAFHRSQYSRYRNAFLISGALSLLAFWLVPTAPPRLLPQWGFVDTVSSSMSYYIWQPPAFVNQYAAMPSLHFAWNVLVNAALVRNLQSRWRYAALLMPAAIGAAAVFSADHFFLDLAAGAIVAFLGLWLAGRLRASLPRSPPFSYLT
jgi:hypothetical protein